MGSNGGDDQAIWKLLFTFLALLTTLGVNSMRIRVSLYLLLVMLDSETNEDRFMENWSTILVGSRLLD